MVKSKPKKVTEKVTEKVKESKSTIKKDNSVLIRLEKYTNYLKIDETTFQCNCPQCETYINTRYNILICPACKQKI